jgi:hypothetical protein
MRPASRAALSPRWSRGLHSSRKGSETVLIAGVRIGIHSVIAAGQPADSVTHGMLQPLARTGIIGALLHPVCSL